MQADIGGNTRQQCGITAALHSLCLPILMLKLALHPAGIQLAMLTLHQQHGQMEALLCCAALTYAVPYGGSDGALWLQMQRVVCEGWCTRGRHPGSACSHEHRHSCVRSVQVVRSVPSASTAQFSGRQFEAVYPINPLGLLQVISIGTDGHSDNFQIVMSDFLERYYPRLPASG